MAAPHGASETRRAVHATRRRRARDARGEPRKAREQLVVVGATAPPLQRQRAELDGQQHGDLVGKGAQVVGRARDASRAGHAAESEDRRALQIRTQPHAVHEARVDRRRRDARHRNEEEMADILGAQLQRTQCSADRVLAEIDRAADPGVVRRAERIELRVVLDRQREMAAPTITFLWSCSSRFALWKRPAHCCFSAASSCSWS
jgi:hypothetical protein